MQPLTRSYQEYLIESLKDPQEAALYLWAILQEENPEPELLSLALKDVAEALGNKKMTPEQTKLHLQRLDELLEQRGSDAIYGLFNWLKDLGLVLTVVVDEPPKDNRSITERGSEVVV
jgi:DNA-binding phage protein